MTSLTAHRFFVYRKHIQGGTCLLEGKENHHLKNVLRKKEGQSVRLFDESGAEYRAVIQKITDERTTLMLSDSLDRKPRGSEIILAQGLLKSRKFEFIVQKCTEMGVSRIVPILCTRSLVKMEDRTPKKLERWKKICLEAAKQSGQTCIPDISQPVEILSLVGQEKKAGSLYLLLSEKGGRHLREFVLDTVKDEKIDAPVSVTLLCGPEGGWTEREEQAILENQFTAVSLGRTILRAETAALSSLAAVTLFWNS